MTPEDERNDRLASKRMRDKLAKQKSRRAVITAGNKYVTAEENQTLHELTPDERNAGIAAIEFYASEASRKNKALEEGKNKKLKKYVTARENETLHELTLDERNASIAALEFNASEASKKRKTREEGNTALDKYVTALNNQTLHELTPDDRCGQGSEE